MNDIPTQCSTNSRNNYSSSQESVDYGIPTQNQKQHGRVKISHHSKPDIPFRLRKTSTQSSIDFQSTPSSEKEPQLSLDFASTPSPLSPRTTPTLKSVSVTQRSECSVELGDETSTPSSNINVRHDEENLFLSPQREHSHHGFFSESSQTSSLQSRNTASLFSLDKFASSSTASTLNEKETETEEKDPSNEEKEKNEEEEEGLEPHSHSDAESYTFPHRSVSRRSRIIDDEIPTQVVEETTICDGISSSSEVEGEDEDVSFDEHLHHNKDDLSFQHIKPQPINPSNTLHPSHRTHLCQYKNSSDNSRIMGRGEENDQPPANSHLYPSSSSESSDTDNELFYRAEKQRRDQQNSKRSSRNKTTVNQTQNQKRQRKNQNKKQTFIWGAKEASDSEDSWHSLDGFIVDENEEPSQHDWSQPGNENLRSLSNLQYNYSGEEDDDNDNDNDEDNEGDAEEGNIIEELGSDFFDSESSRSDEEDDVEVHKNQVKNNYSRKQRIDNSIQEEKNVWSGMLSQSMTQTSNKKKRKASFDLRNKSKRRKLIPLQLTDNTSSLVKSANSKPNISNSVYSETQSIQNQKLEVPTTSLINRGMQSYSQNSALGVYIQYIASCVIDPEFGAAIAHDDEDTYFRPAIHQIQESIIHRKENLVRSSVWSQQFIDILQRYGAITGRSVGHSMECEICQRSGHLAHYRLKLFGTQYDSNQIWEPFSAHVESLPTDHVFRRYFVGQICFTRTLVYHCLHHFKLHLIEQIKFRISNLSEQPPNIIIEILLDDKTWLSEINSQYFKLLEISERYAEPDVWFNKKLNSDSIELIAYAAQMADLITDN